MVFLLIRLFGALLVLSAALRILVWFGEIAARLIRAPGERRMRRELDHSIQERRAEQIRTSHPPLVHFEVTSTRKPPADER
jgi:hypothetical protein